MSSEIKPKYQSGMVSNERVPPTTGNSCSLSELVRNESIEQKEVQSIISYYDFVTG